MKLLNKLLNYLKIKNLQIQENDIVALKKQREIYDKQHEKNIPSIELKNLNIDFGETLAVDNVSFSIPEGKLITLLGGPSGCGKTTTLNSIAGLLIPTSGKNFIQRKRCYKFYSSKKKVRICFFKTMLFIRI